MILALLVLVAAVSSQSLIPPGSCPLFNCITPSQVNATDLFCARRLSNNTFVLYESCPPNYYCSIRQMYLEFIEGDNEEPTFDCKQRRIGGVYMEPMTFDPTLTWKCSNNITKQLAFGNHPKTCMKDDDCVHVDGSMGSCICGVRSVFRSGICTPDRQSKTFDAYWVPCPSGYIDDDNIKRYLQAYHLFYVYTQVEQAVCAQNLFNENIAVWNTSVLISLATGEWFIGVTLWLGAVISWV